MNEPSKAVFLSYASQDAEAAKKICDALRAAGVEVWFDAEGGLEHGDEWDAKIRRQIKECVLFLPVISANTQAREEGYFRIEWELAAQRALGIASGVAFILPIVIDDTREPDALVPDRFRTVQWTRLRAGELTPEVKARFLKLWSHRTGALKHEAVSRGQTTDGGGPTVSARIPSPGWKIYAGLAAAVFALAAGAVWWSLRPGSAPAVVTRPDAAPTGSSMRSTRVWPKDPELKKAFGIISGLDVTVESCRLAEDMINAVLKQRPTDPEATTLYAMLNNYYINRGYDVSEERQVLARRFSERALQLAPEEPEALAAMAQFITFRGADFARAETLIRKAMALAPEDPRFARILVYNVLRPMDPARALAQAKENAARFPDDPLTQYDLALICRGTGDLELMERALDRTLALVPISSALIWKGWLAAWVHGDLAGFKDWLDRISGNYRFNERAVYMHYLYACLSGDTAHGLEALQAFPGSWLNDFYYTGPRSLLLADLLVLAGKPELAQVEYGRALAEIGRMAERYSPDTIWRAEFWALRGAGREADARAAAKRMMQRLNRPYRPPIMQWWHDVIPAQLLAGDRADALALIREAAMVPVVRAQIRTALKIDHRMAPFRDDPEIQALLAESAKTALVRDWPKDPELKKAIALTEGLEAIPDDLMLAEEITKRAVDRSPTDIEAVTVMARVQSHFLRRGFDRSDERAALAKRYAERALQLAPDEPEAMYALATYHFSRATGETARTEQLLRRAMALDPTNPRPGRLLADLFNATNRLDEAIAQGQDNVRRFPNDVLSHYDLARNYKDQGRYDEFDRELDATLALAPLPNAIVWKARLQFGLRNDFAGMKAWLDRVPARVRGTERAVFSYFLYAGLGGDPETGLAALRDFPDKWFTDFEYAGPTALLNASLLELQGKTELARRQYEVAHGEIQRMRQTDPGRIGLSQVEFWTLLGLGRTEEAKVSYRRVVEGTRRPYAQEMVNGWWFTTIPAALLIGDRPTALTLLRESVETRPQSRAAFRLRFQIDPRMAPFRDDPQIVALLAEPRPETVAAPLSEAGKLTARTVTLYSKLNYTREDLAIAEDLGRKATELEPDSAAAWGARAGVQATYLYRNWLASDKRRQDTQTFASRALGLNPDEPEALLALGHLLRNQGVDDQAIIHFRRALAAAPGNLRAARALGTTLSFSGQREEGRAVLLAAVKSDPRDALVRYDLALTYDVYISPSGRPPAEITTAIEHLDAGLAVQPLASLLTAKAVSQGGWLGDLPALRTTLAQLEKLPLAERAEDRSVFVAMWGALLDRDPARAAAAAALTAKNYFEDSVVPRRAKDWSLAIAHRLEGKDNLARLDWQRAESVLRQRLNDDPNNLSRVVELATTLAWLGRTDEALQLVAPAEAAAREEPSRQRSRPLGDFYAAIGDAAKAAPYLRQALNQTVFLTSKTLPLDPWFDKLRGQPEFEALLKEAARK